MSAARDLTHSLLNALPQTQCTRCGYPDCASYAQAIATGQAGINQCPPGGDEVMRELARLAGRDPRPLDPPCGEAKLPAVAIIDEARCIGCGLCVTGCANEAARLERCERIFENFCIVTASVREGIPVSVHVKQPGHPVESESRAREAAMAVAVDEQC